MSVQWRKAESLGRTHHDGENSLLHLSSVLSSENNHLSSLEVDLDGSGGGHSSGESVGGELSTEGDIKLDDIEKGN